MGTDSTGQEFRWGTAGMACDCHIASGASLREFQISEGQSHLEGSSVRRLVSGLGVTQRLDSAGILDGGHPPHLLHVGWRHTAQWGRFWGGHRGRKVQRVSLE